MNPRILLFLSCLVIQDAPKSPAWVKLDTVPYRGKQDDIFFINPETGWYGNGAGKIYKTVDAGKTWKEMIRRPGTFFRCIAFTDAQTGFAGNIGPDSFPGATDETPLYETRDGGETWKPVASIKGPAVKGLCAIDIVKKPVINAGELDYKTIIHAGGRVGGPAFLMTSTDGGASWESQDLGASCGMILDVKFFDAENGLLCAATSPSVEKSNALILTTSDAGKTWTRVYQSTRPYELTWKCSFPTREVGYVTIQSYDPNPKVTQRYVAKTVDGGKTWKEIPLVDDARVREFGVAFVDDTTGWVGAMSGGYYTQDGGATWAPVDMGMAVNKIRILPTADGFVGYAIGSTVHKVTIKKP